MTAALRHPFACICILVAACSGSNTSRTSTPPPPPATAASADAGTPPATPAVCAEAPPATPGLIVASEEGIKEVAPDGAVLRTVSRTPASLARFLPSRRAVVFLARGTAQLRRLDLDTCEERTVATLPRDLGANCGGVWSAPYDPAEYVQEDTDFALTPDGSAACLTLMDRNVNMVNVQAHLRADLATAQTSHVITVGENCGAVEPAQAERSFPCIGVLQQAGRVRAGAATSVAPDTFPCALDGARITRRVARGRPRVVATLALEEPVVESVAPSGRWAVVSGNREEGDSIYRKLYLFDRQSCGVFALRAGAWSAPLTTAQLTTRATLDELGVTATGETTVRWLGDGDTLLVSNLRVEPGTRIATLPGALAW